MSKCRLQLQFFAFLIKECGAKKISIKEWQTKPTKSKNGNPNLKINRKRRRPDLPPLKVGLHISCVGFTCLLAYRELGVLNSHDSIEDSYYNNIKCAAFMHKYQKAFDEAKAKAIDSV